MLKPTLHLASSSPRRAEILRSLGLEFSAHGVDIDEVQQSGESARRMVLRLAEAKALAAGATSADLVLGSDTAVVLDERVFGKPQGLDDAVRMLLELSGRTHVVMTGVAVRSAQGVASTISTTKVRFREIGRDEALAYWHSGEPRDKAGAYGIQGRGGVFVEAIEGSYSGVVGLPVFETARLLERAGLEILKGRIRDD